MELLSSRSHSTVFSKKNIEEAMFLVKKLSPVWFFHKCRCLPYAVISTQIATLSVSLRRWQ